MWKRATRGYATSAENVRNIGIIAHIDAGKTTTTERMLYYSGQTKHIGDVDSGDTVTDYLEAEKARGITIQSAAVTLQWNNRKINLIDTPGHADFTFEVIRSVRVLDGVVTILDGVAGVEAQTEKVWKQAASLGIPRLVFVNKMDRPGAGFGRAVREVVAKLNTQAAMVNIPYFAVPKAGNVHEPVFSGVLDVVNKTAITWDSDSDGRSVQVTPLDKLAESDREELEAARTALIETLTGVDDALVEEFMEVGDYMEMPAASLQAALRRATLANEVVPVLCGASFRNIGVQPLLDAVVNYLPAPGERPPVEAVVVKDTGRRGGHRHAGRHHAETRDVTAIDDKNNKRITIPHAPSGQMHALAFKVTHDANRGVLVFVRVYSGVLKSNSSVINATTGAQERVSKLLQMQADTANEVRAIEAGNIGVIAGSRNIRTGDTLVGSAASRGVRLQPIAAPPPVFFASISPQSVADTRSMEEGLDRLLREDPSLHVGHDSETGQTLLSGMGELHLEIARDRLLNDLKAKVHVGSIMVSYKETLAAETGIHEAEHAVADSHGTSRATARVSVAPIDLYDEDNTANLSPVDPVDQLYLSMAEPETNPLVPVAAIEDAAHVGALPALAVGGKALRLPLYGLEVRVESLSVSADSTTAAAVAPAVRAAVEAALASVDKAAYAILEPVMDMRVVVNEEDIGSVVHDITGTRRGQVLAVGGGAAATESDTDLDTDASHFYASTAASMWVPRDTTMHMSRHDVRTTSAQSVIEARIPLRSAVGYLSALRSMTQGRGTFQMHFSRYEHVPPECVDQVVDSF